MFTIITEMVADYASFRYADVWVDIYPEVVVISDVQRLQPSVIYSRPRN